MPTVFMMVGQKRMASSRHIADIFDENTLRSMTHNGARRMAHGGAVDAEMPLLKRTKRVCETESFMKALAQFETEQVPTLKRTQRVRDIEGLLEYVNNM